jgi:predicted 3-demethylubiquinone-9 3-methyltransferase (glyoxalase superfamily)
MRSIFLEQAHRRRCREAGICGWLKDKFGLSWQVVPTALGRYLGAPDKAADRAMQAMMQIKKIFIADLDRAFAG